MTHWSKRFTVIPSVYIILERQGKILLLRRQGTGYRDGFYSLPAGHLDGGEPATVAAVRECEEEVGVKLKPSDLEVVHVLHRVAEEGSHERIDIFFRAKTFQGEPVIGEPDKCDELRWADPANLPQDMIPLVRDAVEAIQQGRVYSETGFSA